MQADGWAVRSSASQAALLLAIDVVAVAVQGDDVPGADVVAVPAGAGLAGRGAEVLVVGRRLEDVVVVVPGDRGGCGP